MEQEELPDPFVLTTGRVPDVGLGMQRARQDPEIRQSADEGVGGRLEDPNEERPGLVGGHGDRRTALVRGACRGFIGRGGEVAHDGVEQPSKPDPLGRAADQHRREDALLDALPQARLELRVGDLLAVEVLAQDIVIGLGGGLEELVAAPGDLVGHVVGDRDLRLGGAVPLPCLAMDEVDVASERLRRSDGQLERRHLLPERPAQRIECGGRVGVLAIALVDEETGCRPRPPTDRDGVLQTGLDAARRIHHEDRAVRGREPFDDLGDEVRIAGRIDQRDPGLVTFERTHRETQGLSPLLLLGLEVQVGGPVVDPTEPRDGPGLEHELFGERGLARTDVAGQHDAAKVGEVDALHRHRAR